MIRFSFKWVVILFAVCLLLPANAIAGKFQGHLAGTQLPAAIDTNGDGAYANEMAGAGRFTKLGKTTARGLSEVLPWDYVSMCSESEVSLEQYYFHMILTSESGDMLFTEQSDLDLCPNFNVGSWTAVHYMVVTGGTGRFSEATGSLVCDNAGSPLLNPDGAVIGYTWETDCLGELHGVEDD